MRLDLAGAIPALSYAELISFIEVKKCHSAKCPSVEVTYNITGMLLAT